MTISRCYCGPGGPGGGSRERLRSTQGKVCRTLGSQCTGGGDELGSKVEVLTLYLRGREESKRVRNTTKVRMQVEAGLMEAKS